MPRVVARLRALAALILLLSGGIGSVASAHASTCPNRVAVGAAAAVETAVSGSAAARAIVSSAIDLIDGGSRSPVPDSDSPALISSSCTSTAALPAGHVGVASLRRPALSPMPPAESPRGDLLASFFFRPPRAS